MLRSFPVFGVTECALEFVLWKLSLKHVDALRCTAEVSLELHGNPDQYTIKARTSTKIEVEVETLWY